MLYGIQPEENAKDLPLYSFFCYMTGIMPTPGVLFLTCVQSRASYQVPEVVLS